MADDKQDTTAKGDEANAGGVGTNGKANARLAAFARVLNGSGEPNTKKIKLKLHPDDDNYVEVVFRELTDGDNAHVLARVGEQTSQEVKDGLWISEPLAHSIVSVDGEPWPESIEERREIVSKVHKSITDTLAQAYQAFFDETHEALTLIYTDDPFLSGATTGGSFAHGASGRTHAN